MAKDFKIHLKVAGKSFPLMIEREKEERYRRAERDVNDLVVAFKRYRADTQDDYLAMAALQLAVNCVELEMKGSLESETEKLKEIEKQLDDYLKEI